MEGADSLVLPDGAGAQLRHRLGLGPGDALRIAYLPGAGDVAGTYGHWRAGRSDPRVPVISYSAMFYDLMQRLDAQVEVLTPWPMAAPVESDPWIRFVPVTRRPWSGRISYQLNEAAYLREMAAHLDRFAPQVVLAASDVLPRAWPRLARGRRLVLSAHNTFWPMGRPPGGAKAVLRRALLRRQARSLAAAVATSAECARQIAEITDGRLRAPVEYPQVIAQYPPEQRTRARRLLFLGRIEVNKGIFLLLEAFAALRPRYPDLELTFAGAGAAAAALEQAIAAQGLGGLRFAGMLDAEGVHREIAQADLIVCPTTSAFNEGLALVAFEAAAHGIPSLLSSVVPAADTLGAGCAVCAADSAPELTAALDRLVSDEAAYRALCDHLGAVAAGMHDRARSWGTRLGEVLLAL